jgi:hypothetical protein
MEELTRARFEPLLKNYGPGPAKLPSPTVRMLTCVNYLVDPKLRTIKNILAHAAQHIGPDAILSLSWARLAHISGYHRRSVHRALLVAEKHGYIKRLSEGRGRGKTTRYRVLLLARYPEAARRNMAWPTEPKDDTMAPFAGPQAGKKDDTRSPFRAQKVTGRPAIGDTVAPDPNLGSYIKDSSHYPYRSAEETKRYLAEVLAKDA